jgi:hypothetical protein
MAGIRASDLSQENILRDVHDPVNQVLRTSASLTLEAGNIDIAIDHSSDSVKIGDGTRFVSVTGANALKIDGSATIQPISAASLPLPTGAATETTLSSIDTKLSSGIVISDGGLSITVDGTIAATQSGTWNINNISGSISLPTGAATETTLSAINTKLAGAISVTATNLDIRDLTFATDSVSAVQSGTWNINNISGTVSLPTGAATSALQTTANSSLSSIDSKLTNGNQLTKITDGAGVVNTKQLGTAVTSSDVGLVTNTVIHGLTTGGGGGYVDVKVNPSGAMVVNASGSTVSATQSGTWNINNISGTVSLPTGAATETTLAAIDTKLAGTLTTNLSASSLAALENITVSATDLDIRNLSASIDNVAISDGVSTLDINTNGSLNIKRDNLNTASVTSVTVTTASSTLVSANTSRRGLVLYNDSGKVVSIKYGTGTTSASFTYKIATGSAFEMPEPIYNGLISGITASGSGPVLVTELT